MRNIVRLKILSAGHQPSEVTDLLGIKPTRTWVKGDHRAATIIPEVTNGWMLGSSLPEHMELHRHLEHLFQTLSPVASRIRELSLEKGITVELSCVIYSDHVPALNFDSQTVECLAKLRASLDVDLYITE